MSEAQNCKRSSVHAYVTKHKQTGRKPDLKADTETTRSVLRSALEWRKHSSSVRMEMELNFSCRCGRGKASTVHNIYT